MKNKLHLAIAVLLFASAAGAERSAYRFAVSPGDIANGLRKAGVDLAPENVEPLSSIPAKKEHPELKVTHWGHWQANIVKAEMRCVEANVCLPFYVLVHDNSGTGTDDRAKQSGLSRMMDGKPEKHDVHVGDLALLVFERPDSQIRIKVVCTENGNLGQKIRVASADRRHFYDAEVIEPGFLKGSF